MNRYNKVQNIDNKGKVFADMIFTILPLIYPINLPMLTIVMNNSFKRRRMMKEIFFNDYHDLVETIFY